MTLDKNTEIVTVESFKPIKGSKAAMLRIMLADAADHDCTVTIRTSGNGHVTVQCEHNESCPAYLN